MAWQKERPTGEYFVNEKIAKTTKVQLTLYNLWMFISPMKMNTVTLLSTIMKRCKLQGRVADDVD